MKKTTLLLLFGFSLLQARTQKNRPLPKPLIVQGKLEHCPETLLHVYFRNEHNQPELDSIPVKRDGSFYFKTFKCVIPQRVSFQQRKTQINDIFVAPGYDLTITGDVTDSKTLATTIRISGKGSESNQYRKATGLWFMEHPADTAWFMIRAQSNLVKFVNFQRRSLDSIAQVVFNRKANNDPYFSHFKKMVLLDNRFLNLYYLLSYANDNKMGPQETERFIRDHSDRNVLKDLNNEDNLISKDFKGWTLTAYTDYLLRLDYLKDSTLKENKNYRLEKIITVYAGKVKDFALANNMRENIFFTKSIDRLNALKERYGPYLDMITDTAYKKIIETQISDKENDLMRTAIGKPAPGFSLPSDKGRTYKLSDFAGKVVYLDLWASWCSPCRAETPFLSAIYEKYKNDTRIAFVSIAVSDAETSWREALTQDKPGWLQLWDKENVVKMAYVANMIPQFVIINKKGEIVNFNAPKPSDEPILEALLKKEMLLE
jgi:thiol-disulfide isomerase/thioredoxin